MLDCFKKFLSCLQLYLIRARNINSIFIANIFVKGNSAKSIFI